MIEVGIFAFGLLFGAALVRYGMGLGYKAIYQAKEDMPLVGDKAEPYPYASTEDEPIEQEETEDL